MKIELASRTVCDIFTRYFFCLFFFFTTKTAESIQICFFLLRDKVREGESDVELFMRNLHTLDMEKKLFFLFCVFRCLVTNLKAIVCVKRVEILSCDKHYEMKRHTK